MVGRRALWTDLRRLRPGVCYFLPSIGTTTTLGDLVLQVCWLKWACMAGWRIPPATTEEHAL